jgi:hypothetical protein
MAARRCGCCDAATSRSFYAYDAHAYAALEIVAQTGVPPVRCCFFYIPSAWKLKGLSKYNNLGHEAKFLLIGVDKLITIRRIFFRSSRSNSSCFVAAPIRALRYLLHISSHQPMTNVERRGDIWNQYKGVIF